MRPVPPLLLSLLLFGVSLGIGFAQDRVSVVFKVFPPGYEVFSAGDRLPYTNRGDGTRAYLLPSGAVRVNLTAAGSFPQSLSLQVKAGMGVVQAKLEPRQGPLTFVAEKTTGKWPRSVAFSLDGKSLYVALKGEPGIDVFEVPSLTKTGRLTVDGAASGFTDVLAVGDELWTIQIDGRLHVFDASGVTLKDSRQLTGGGNAFLTALGADRIAVTNWDTGLLQSVDRTTRKPVAATTIAGSVRGFFFSKGTGWATLFDQGKIVLLDGAGWKTKTIWSVGKSPRPVAVLGDSLFVGDMASAQVLMVSASTGKLLKSVPVASNPQTMQVSPDQTLLAIASRGKNNPTDYQLAGPDFGKVTLLNAQGQEIGSVWGRNQPTGLAFSPDGKYLAFTDYLDNNLELYRVTP